MGVASGMFLRKMDHSAQKIVDRIEAAREDQVLRVEVGDLEAR
jgi:hypothetical protein